MAIRVALNHVTTYTYDRHVQLSPHVVRLRPAPHSRTNVTAYSLRISPEPHFLNWQQDPFSNWQARLVFPEPAREMRVEVDLVADLTAINPFDFFLEEYAEEVPFTYEPELRQELLPYLHTSTEGELFHKLVERTQREILHPERRTVDVLVDINQLIQSSLRYDIRMEPGVFAPEETLTRGHGSCRDFSWLMVNLMRKVGFAARFVSGYSIQLKADQKPMEGPEGVQEDCTDLHAWTEVFLPGAGWVGLDATSGLFCGEGHIPLACTAEPGSAAPVTGAYAWSKRSDDDQVKEEFAFTMKVTRLEDRPRPTKPFSEQQWQDLLACGRQVEADLVSGDVRLTMGGEPTFVSADDPDGDEWNTAAVGPTKQRYADALLKRLHRRFAEGGLLHHGQGKWYPGEPLPRWAFSCYFRRDGEPVWQDPSLFAAEGTQFTIDQGKALVEAIAARLGVSDKFVQPGFEDTYYYLWRERRLPVNVDPFENRLDDKIERDRIRRVFEQGLKTVVGYALPVSPNWENGQLYWSTGPWFLRDERMYLIPGDSPMGFRLPLDSLPWTAPEDRTWHAERDPMEARLALPKRSELGKKRPLNEDEGPEKPAVGKSAHNLTRTALCIEPRDGILHVFMPPLGLLEEYLDLSACIEHAAAELGVSVRLEGYHPPSDPRLNRIQVTPDPGVIEVNIHPAHSFDDVVETTTTLYQEARDVHLASDKFMLDGRHTGTGGGNHITLGGQSAADSPFLRRPDLLRSMTSYWLNHPSLSYLFSGLFVGPTSQAPRIDEARHDSLYELDIAFNALRNSQRHSAEPPPWLVDRIFRHLLVDSTGNTHRTEMCIDKLFSPDSASGRQGIVEMRAFEMPPDARMSCAAQLLVRGLIAWFWQKPYEQRVVRWNTTLLDRYMLPQFAHQDFRDVIEDLNRAGYPFDMAWFEPQYEFRFPLLGRVQAGGLELELRQAIEPWHVLGEQPSFTSTVRYVDSSVERLQVVVRNMTSPRHVVACNGHLVPLHPTGTSGEYVAGVRYRAWNPPNSLHPTVPVHAPLVFDLFDTWSERAIGGCTYHVGHPGGRSYDIFPRNALEAESRRISRFFAFGHSPGQSPAPKSVRSEEFPLTLDLRRAGS